ncbi:MAG: hypothetical protein WAW06_09975 [bacterium]
MADDKTELNARVDNKRQACFLMLNCLLLTRIPEDTEPDPSKKQAAARERERYHEEISTYLRSLSAGFSSPANAEHLKPYLFDYDIEALKRMAASRDAALRYVVCRAAGDVLILSVGVFDKGQAARAAKARQGPPDYRHGTQGQMGRGETYFHFAFSYADTVADAAEAVSSVCAKIATGLEKYAAILAYVTGCPYELPARMKDCEVHYFSRSVETTGTQRRLERKRNQFLDAYLEWKACPTVEAKQRLALAADELKQMDPTFNYAPEAK